MKVLVTGASGFVGREVWKQLGRTAYERYGADIRRTEGIDYLDFMQLGDISAYLREKRFGQDDAVINLAAKVAGKPSLENPAGYISNNYVEVLNLGEAMRLLRMRNLIHVSSWSVYGSKTRLPITENTPPYAGNPYGVSKELCENVVRMYASLYDVRALILRPTMIYGPGQEEENVFKQVVNSMAEGKTLELYGTGEHTREFLHVRDAARIMIQSLEVVKKVPTCEVFVLGTENPISIAEFVIKARKISEFPVVLRPSSKWTFSQRSDMTKLKQWFGVDPKDFIPIEEGLRESLEYRKLT